MSQQPSGWYDDPSTPDTLRYWDGVTWTSHTAPKKSPTLPQSTGGVPVRPDATGAATQGVPTATTPLPQGSGWQDQTSGYGQGYGHEQGQRAAAPPPYAGAPANAAWMQSVKTTADGVPLASWGRRLGAWLIDGIILTVLSVLLSRALAPDLWTEFGRLMDLASTGSQAEVEAAANNLTPTITAASARLGIGQFLLVLVYCLAFWTTTAQTPGKMAVGISVRRADRPGPLDISTAVRRRLISAVQLVPFVSGLYVIIFLVDYLWPLWDVKRQSLHDKVAATQVVVGKQPRSKG
ncbi:MAG: domain containing protein [Humibacillus sp.]|nr:domain containing protein [Humibacillus sp.]